MKRLLLIILTTISLTTVSCDWFSWFTGDTDETDGTASGSSGSGSSALTTLPDYKGGFYLSYDPDCGGGLVWFELTETVDFVSPDAEDSAGLHFNYPSDPGLTVPENGEYQLGSYSPDSFTPAGGVSFHIDKGDYEYISQSGTLTISNSNSSGDGSYTITTDGVYSQYTKDPLELIGTVNIQGSCNVVQYAKPAVFE